MFGINQVEFVDEWLKKYQERYCSRPETKEKRKKYLKEYRSCSNIKEKIKDLKQAIALYEKEGI